MSGIKQLAGQTLWYGVSSIAARFLNYLLTPYLTLQLSGADYGEMSAVYAAIPLFNILFTYGLETAYFRFASDAQRAVAVYSTATLSLIGSTVVLTALLLLLRGPMAGAIGLESHPEYFTLAAGIIALDALSALSFAKLRLDGRPVKYALIRVGAILVNIGLTFFFLSVCPRLQESDPHSFIGTFYRKEDAVKYILLANLVQSAFTFLLLTREFFSFRLQFDTALWKELIRYSAPLILVGLAGMINETFDRLMLIWWSTEPGQEATLLQVGIYSACYKLSLLISLFIQAFRMGAEPFFFKQAQGAQPQRTYARVMKFFVITVCLMFLAVALFLDIWKYFIQNPRLWEGLKVVPVLLLANMFLGIYYNLSVWYKLTNNTMAGAWITLIGVAITFTINFLFIPKYGYMACAWATFFCYGTMMILSYTRGQKAYRIPYATKKLLAYMIIAVALFGLHRLFAGFGLNVWLNHAFGALLLACYAAFIGKIEQKELKRLPVIGKYF